MDKLMKKFCIVLDEEELKKAQQNALKMDKIKPAIIYNTSKFIRELLKRIAEYQEPNK